MNETTVQEVGFTESIEQLYPAHVLETLLKDRTTGRNIIWADNEYEALGDGYQGDDEVTIEKITGAFSGVIKPRVAKEREKQSQRTREHAEVFTPSWLVNQMNNYMDADWFGRNNVFNYEKEMVVSIGKPPLSNPPDVVKVKRYWEARTESIVFDNGKTWQDYVDLTKLEITCGEAPFVCSRYDTVTGDALPVSERVGFLDRKLRVVTENAADYSEWWEWALRALQSSYAYEYQGDNLTIARINALETMAETKADRWGDRLTDGEALQVAEIVSWNFWQMDGLKGIVPTDKPIDEKELDRISGKDNGQMDMLGLFGFEDEPEEEKAQFCMIYDWREGKAQEYVSLRS